MQCRKSIQKIKQREGNKSDNLCYRNKSNTTITILKNERLDSTSNIFLHFGCTNIIFVDSKITKIMGKERKRERKIERKRE